MYIPVPDEAGTLVSSASAAITRSFRLLILTIRYCGDESVKVSEFPLFVAVIPKARGEIRYVLMVSLAVMVIVVVPEKEKLQ
ncbi:hypothetical protein D3C81_2194130 [compost metagenome]